MYRNIFVLGLTALLSTSNAAFSLNHNELPLFTVDDKPEDALIGRWDITVDENGKSTPAWLEVRRSGFSTLVGSFVGASGSARPVSKITFESGKFSFTIPPQWERGGGDFVIEGELSAAELKGTMLTNKGVRYTWKGVKAPLLKREGKVSWGKTVELFNGKDLKGWKAMGENQWMVKAGVLTSPHSGANLISDQKFQDFKLHVEFRYKKGSNSGVYLRGRHEVQIEDNPKDAHPSSILFGGIYGFLPPSEIAALGPNEWQSFDITLIGRMVTIVANGKTVISNQEIPGITGGALDSNEAEAGPIYIQGDHGPIEFRKISITPAR